MPLEAFPAPSMGLIRASIVARSDRTDGEMGANAQRMDAIGIRHVVLEFGSERYVGGGLAHASAGDVHLCVQLQQPWPMSAGPSACPVLGLSGDPLNPSSYAEQVTRLVTSRRVKTECPKMDKFFTDASHKRACILITCSRPDKLTLSVMQYLVPRRVMFEPAPDQPIELAHSGVAGHFQGARNSDWQWRASPQRGR